MSQVSRYTRGIPGAKYIVRGVGLGFFSDTGVAQIHLAIAALKLPANQYQGIFKHLPAWIVTKVPSANAPLGSWPISVRTDGPL